MDICKTFGLNVRTIRKQLGLSQEELAFACGLHRTYISGVERGVRNPTLLVVNQLSDALQVSPDTLLKERTTP